MTVSETTSSHFEADYACWCSAGNDPYKPSPMVSFQGIPRFIPSFPTEQQQIMSTGRKSQGRKGACPKVSFESHLAVQQGVVGELPHIDLWVLNGGGVGETLLASVWVK